MIPTKITTIDIQPSTHVRSTKNEGWLLADSVSYEYLDKLDNERIFKKGKKGTLAARKKQLEIHNAHKKEIRDWAIRNDFKMPLGYFAAWFYVPMPPSWRPKKRAEMIYTVHQNTPDLDNYLKQLYDSIMPRKNRLKKEKGTDDRKIFCYASFKVWVPVEEACIKIIEYNPGDFMEEFKHGNPSYKEAPVETGAGPKRAYEKV